MNNKAGTVRRRRGFVAASILSAFLVMATLVACDPEPVAIVKNPPNAPSTIENLIPLYGLTDKLNPNDPTANHYYTTDPTERDDMRKTGTWHLDPTTANCDGIVGYVYDRKFSWVDSSGALTQSSVPFVRFTNTKTQATDYKRVGPNDNMAATVSAEQAAGYDDAKILGYVLDDSTAAHETKPSGTVDVNGNPYPTAADPVALEWSPSGGQHYLERVTTSPGSNDPQALAYVIDAPVPDSVASDATPLSQPFANPQRCPVTMLTNGTQHFATADIHERADKLAAGWTIDPGNLAPGAAGDAVDGVLGYVWSAPDTSANPNVKPVAGTVPLVRFYRASTGSYFYDAETDPTTYQPPTGYVRDDTPLYSATLGYVFAPAPANDKTLDAPDTIDVNAYANQAGDYYFTSTSVGQSNAVALGYTNGPTPRFKLFSSVDHDVPYYELWKSTTAGAPIGTMIVMHSGGWHGGLDHVQGGKGFRADLSAYTIPTLPSAFGPWGAARKMTPDFSGPADDNDMIGRYTNDGWTVYNIDYHSGGQRAFADVDAVYRDLRARLGPQAKICAAGESAGGQLALMLAVKEHDLSCAISDAGPTDLSLLNDEIAPLVQVQFLPDLVPDAFGPKNDGTVWAAYSPAFQVAGMTAKTLLATSSGDQFVPPAQQDEFHTQAVDAEVANEPVIDELPTTLSTCPDAQGKPDAKCPGHVFVHDEVTQDSFDAYMLLEQTFLAGI